MLPAIVFFLYFFVILFDFAPTRKSRTAKGTFVYWSMLTISFCVLFLYSLDIQVPGPTEPIKTIVEVLFHPAG